MVNDVSNTELVDSRVSISNGEPLLHTIHYIIIIIIFVETRKYFPTNFRSPQLLTYNNLSQYQHLFTIRNRFIRFNPSFLRNNTVRTGNSSILQDSVSFNKCIKLSIVKFDLFIYVLMISSNWSFS